MRIDFDRARRIARRIVAGGGAGIEFKVKQISAELKYFAQGVPGCWMLKPAATNSVAIDCFNAEGYMDGMDNVDGRKVFSEVSVSQDEIYNAINENISHMAEDDEEFVRQLYDGFNVDISLSGSTSGNVLFGGFVRASLKQGDTVDFTCNAGIYMDVDAQQWDTDYELTVTGTLSQDGQRWYQDVFEWACPDTDEDGEPVEPEIESEIHWQNCEFDYGYSGSTAGVTVAGVQGIAGRVANDFCRRIGLRVAATQIAKVGCRVVDGGVEVYCWFDNPGNRDQFLGFFDESLSLTSEIDALAKKFGMVCDKNAMPEGKVGGDSSVVFPFYYKAGQQGEPDFDGFVAELKSKYNCQDVK